MNDKFIVLGSSGMLGQSLVKELKIYNKTVIGVAKTNTDVCIDVTNDNDLLKSIDKINPDVIINTVAIVDLKYCQENPDLCYMINARVSLILSRYCQVNNIKYVYISTDYYFTKGYYKKHSERSKVNLCNEYSISKYLGEKLTLTNDKALVVRTNIVGFRNNKNQPTFVEWVINTLKEHKQMSLYNNVFTSSIDTKSFSKYLLMLIDKDISGLINLASSEVSSKEKFITTLANKFNLSIENTRINSMDLLSQNITRNESLGLNVSKAEGILNYSLPTLTQVIDNLSIEYIKYDKRKENFY